MRFAYLLTPLLFAAACSAKQPAERNVPQCLSMCGNQFAACTEEFPGDAAACQPSRSECERTCRGEQAIQRMEGGDGDVIAPVEPMPSPQPAATPDAGTDGGS